MALDFPSNPVDGEVFGSYVWSTSKGVWQSREESATVAITSPTAPLSANNGDLWYDTNRGVTYVYYNDGSSSQWVEVVTSGTPELSTKANLSGGNTFSGVQTLNTPLAIASGGTGSNSLSSAQSNLQIPLSPNYIINGSFEINQRSLTSTTMTGYGFDRWFFTYAGGTATHSSQAFAIGAGPLPDSSATFARTVTTGQSASSDLAYIAQRVEGVRTLAGKTVTISFWAKSASAGARVSVELNQWFGAGGSTETNTPSGSISISTSWARYSATMTVPNISGRTIGTNDFLNVMLWFSAGATFATRSSSIGLQNNTFDIWGVQLEEGSAATPFRRNSNSFQAELAACQRYFIRLSSDGSATNFNFYGTGSMYQPTLGLVTIPYPVTMRRRPTVTTSAANTFQILTASSNIVCSIITATDTNQSAQVAALDITSSSTISNVAGFTFRSNGATSWIHADAEL